MLFAKVLRERSEVRGSPFYISSAIRPLSSLIFCFSQMNSSMNLWRRFVNRDYVGITSLWLSAELVCWCQKIWDITEVVMMVSISKIGSDPNRAIWADRCAFRFLQGKEDRFEIPLCLGGFFILFKSGPNIFWNDWGIFAKDVVQGSLLRKVLY
jgi:hypothetical protein